MANEKRLIDARFLTSQMYMICEVCQTENIFIDAIIDEIDNAPDVDAVEVVHGRWVFGTANHREYLKCSECLHSYTPDGTWCYCPNCGAKMDEEGRFVGICEHCAYREDCEWPKLHPKIKLKECLDFNKGDKK